MEGFINKNVPHRKVPTIDIHFIKRIIESLFAVEPPPTPLAKWSKAHLDKRLFPRKREYMFDPCQEVYFL